MCYHNTSKMICHRGASLSKHALLPPDDKSFTTVKALIKAPF